MADQGTHQIRTGTPHYHESGSFWTPPFVSTDWGEHLWLKKVCGLEDATPDQDATPDEIPVKIYDAYFIINTLALRAEKIQIAGINLIASGRKWQDIRLANFNVLGASSLWQNIKLFDLYVPTGIWDIVEPIEVVPYVAYLWDGSKWGRARSNRYVYHKINEEWHEIGVLKNG